MVSGITTRRYPNNLLSFKGRPMRSTVVARKAILNMKNKQANMAFILRHGNRDELAFAPADRDDLLVSRPMDRRQVRGLYNYAKDAKSIEGIRAYFGLYPKAYLISQSEVRKHRPIINSAAQKEQRRAGLIRAIR